MITIEQCRAARGLLGWTQQELADIAGLSKTAINNFEKAHSDIKRESLIAIQNALENAGIEFLSHNGLRKKTEDVKIIRGADIYTTLIQDILQSTAHNDGEILIANYDASEGGFETLTTGKYLQQLKNIAQQTRILCTNTNADYEQSFRVLQAEHFLQSGSFVVYGHKVALQPWQQPIFVVIDSPDVSIAERHRFETLWNLAEKPSRYYSALKQAKGQP